MDKQLVDRLIDEADPFVDGLKPHDALRAFAARFAALVAEECAKVAHGDGQQNKYDEYGAGREEAADAIRAAFPKESP